MELDLGKGKLINATGKIFKITLPKEFGPVLYVDKGKLGANGAGIPTMGDPWSYHGKPEKHGTTLLFGVPYIAEEITPPVWWEMKDKLQ